MMWSLREKMIQNMLWKSLSSKTTPTDVELTMIDIPSKYTVAQVMGFIKGKSAIHLAQVYGEQKRGRAQFHFETPECPWSVPCDILDFSKIEAGEMDLDRRRSQLPMLPDQAGEDIAAHNRSDGSETFQKSIPVFPCHAAKRIGRRHAGRQIHSSLSGGRAKHWIQYGFQKIQAAINLAARSASAALQSGHHLCKHGAQSLVPEG